MFRTYTYTALILRVKPSGESNRDLWFLSAEEGILRATVFGGAKSKLRAHTAPFNRGKLWIYHDPVRDSRKVTDFDVQRWRPGLRECYERSAAASAIAETILAAHGGGGDWRLALDMADLALDALDTADENTCRRIFLHFLWNWLEHLGLRPDITRCGSCGAEVPSGGRLWYTPEEGLLCADCVDGVTLEEPLPAGPGCRRWLLAAQNLAPSLLGRYTMDGDSTRETGALITTVLAGALGKRLSTWDW
ncbi:MAG: DNA repair protein RecO C-terminal domain-containing protein [Treponema sp.]|jgi:DNA repair protein RecO (recombination protein O)|nr:DNA repair protein RecO C-terminal domain-containing protein [Treponema sp.]